MPKKSVKDEIVEGEVVADKDASVNAVEQADRGGVFWGMVLVAVGAVLIAESVTDVNLWQYFWPAVLIVFGLSLVFRSFRS